MTCSPIGQLAIIAILRDSVNCTQFQQNSLIRDDIHIKKNRLNGHCPLSSDPPPRLNGQGGPFSGRQKRHFSAYRRIKFKLILIMKMMISVMKMVIVLMIMVMKMTKKQTNTMGFLVKYTPFRHYYLVKQARKSSEDTHFTEYARFEKVRAR